ncbi:MAG: ABC transporter permease [Egibacteraceae bacterium]
MSLGQVNERFDGFNLVEATRRAIQVNHAFFRVGWLNVIGYPLAFATTQLSALLPICIYFFVARLVADTPAVGGDYYTFVVIGVIVMKLLDGSLRGFGALLDNEIQEGRLETLLVEPIRWRLLPFGMVQFQLVTRIIVAGVMLIISLLFGASFQPAGFSAGLLVLALGLAVTLALGILGASVKVLSKRSDPLLTFYTMVASLFSGALFPIESLPGWARLVSYAIPETYVIAALRKLLMPGGEMLPGMETGDAIIVLIGFCLVLYPISLWMYGRSLEYGRRLGLLAGY